MRLVKLLMCLLLMSCQTTIRPELTPIVSLNGEWKFNIGDDTSWINSEFNDRDWDNMKVPGAWEQQGYVGYDGYAWYRTKVVIPFVEKNYLVMDLGNIDDVNEVFFNGIRIGQLGIFPPKFVSAYDAPIRYYIPSELLHFNDVNNIAIRVFDNMDDGGIIGKNIIIGYEIDIDLIDQNLSGKWLISFEYDKQWTDRYFNDNDWSTIYVPASWESQGYNDYNGIGCYRKQFDLAPELKDEDLYLILGKIDDDEKVYVNGELIGSTSQLNDNSLTRTNFGDWQKRRAYKIPKRLLNQQASNQIAVIVSDIGGLGGIFEGPIGIMTENHYKTYVNRHKFNALQRLKVDFRVD